MTPKIEEHIGRLINVVRWFLIREDKRRESAVYDHRGLRSPNEGKEMPR